MCRHLQLAALLLLTGALARAQTSPPPAANPPESRPDKKAKSVREDVEWLWQYTPPPADGRENELVQDLRFRPLLDQYLTAPQTFWGYPIQGKYRSLANTALDFLSVPDKVLADEKRYVSISGCVVHFCPSRGLLWVDLNGSHHLVVFAAIQWIEASKAVTQPDAQYTLWVFPDEVFSTAPSKGSQLIPAALTRSIARWSLEPLPGSGIVQNITRAILVDPDGTPHEVAPSALGVTPPPPLKQSP
jgi:hypothetical protein